MTQQHIGRYEIIKEIGSGGFATVYQARDTALNREVAIKVMRPLLMSDSVFVARFQKEAQVAANLDHPHIIPIYDYGEFEGRLYLVMKLMANSLENLLAEKPLPFDQALAIFQQIAAGLDYAHERGIVHRDLKPDNILLDEQGKATIADFGLVKAMQGSASLTMSISGGILGTPSYMAPELWHGHEATPAADIYALGCLLYQMIKGQKLFDAPTPPAIMALHFADIELPEKWPKGTPPRLTETLRRALSQDIVRRYATAGELAAALGKLVIDPLAEPYAALQTAMANQEWSDAIALAETILVQHSKYKETPKLLALALEGSLEARQAVLIEEWREQAQIALALRDWPTALAAAQHWQQISPQDAEASAIVEQAEEEIARKIDQTAKLAAIGFRRVPEETLDLKSQISQPDQNDTATTFTLAPNRITTSFRIKTSSRYWFISGGIVILVFLSLLTTVVVGNWQFDGNAGSPSEVNQTDIAAVVPEITSQMTPSITLSPSRHLSETSSHTPLPAHTSTYTPTPSRTPLSTHPSTYTPTPTRTPTSTHTRTPTLTPHPTDTPTLQAREIRYINLLEGGSVAIIYVPAGPFVMGSESNLARDAEKPVHQAITRAYWIDRAPVTNAQFAAFIAATGYQTTAEIEGTGRVWHEDGVWRPISGANWQSPQGPDSDFQASGIHPVVQVSWYDASAFCDWRAARLPTEIEWEKAARGTDERIYPWGNQFDGANLNYCDQNCPLPWRDALVDDGHAFTAPVGSYTTGASFYGVLDMVGNVWEWTNSWFTAYPGNTIDTGYGTVNRVLRGGSWNLNPRDARASFRFSYAPGNRADTTGFRCASDDP